MHDNVVFVCSQTRDACLKLNNLIWRRKLWRCCCSRYFCIPIYCYYSGFRKFVFHKVV